MLKTVSMSALFLAATMSWSQIAWADEPKTDESAAEEVQEETNDAEMADEDKAEEEMAEEATGDDGKMDSATADYIYGDPDAPVTLYEYASFTCPHCAEFEKTVFPQVQETYIDTGLVNLVYREVYFDGAGLLAASLARCVPEEQYYPMVFTLYETLPNWFIGQESAEGIITELSKLGVSAGLPKDDITACLDNRDMQEMMIENAQKNMEDDKVKGTPTLIVDGDKPESWDWPTLQAFLNEKLEDAGVEAPEAEAQQ